MSRFGIRIAVAALLASCSALIGCDSQATPHDSGVEPPTYLEPGSPPTSTIASTPTPSPAPPRGPTTAIEPTPESTMPTRPQSKQPSGSVPATSGCHASYDPCVPITSDVDCIGGKGNGPAYTGRVRVVGPDDYELDRDGDGIGCEND